MSSEFESLKQAVQYAKDLGHDTNVYYTEDPFPHGHWHVIQSNFEHYNEHPKFTLKAKIRFCPTVQYL